MAIQTMLTSTLGISKPIIQGGMMWVGYAEMAAAVSNAGGLDWIDSAFSRGTTERVYIPHLYSDEIDLFLSRIRRCRKMTSKPFGVNITLLPAITPPDYVGYAKVIVEERINIVETAGNNPQLVINVFRNAPYKIYIIHKCTSIRHALSAQKLGVDFLSIDGFECAGHPGEDDVPGLVLLALAAKKLNLPYIASGGFGDGRGLAAALALGAQGINMGTRFMATKEAPIHESIKQELVKATEHDTALIMRTFRNTARMFKNSIAQQVIEIEKSSATPDFRKIQPLVAGIRGRRVFTEGDKEAGVWTAGQIAGLIDDVPTCEELLSRIEKEAEEIIECIARKVTTIQSKL